VGDTVAEVLSDPVVHTVGEVDPEKEGEKVPLTVPLGLPVRHRVGE